MKIRAPLSGISVPLYEVPDEAFSTKMVGDGISIDPVDSILRSPVDGVVEFIHPSRHALTLKSGNTSVLIHIGVDTVQLKGEGFKALVKTGQQVKAGEALIEFDLDFVAARAKSLVTQVLITNPEDFSFSGFATGFVRADESVLFEISGHKSASATPEKKSGTQKSRSFICSLGTGLHARPAAAIVQTAKRFSSDVSLKKNQQSANAKSLVSILSLSVEYGDSFEVVTFGDDALAALDALTELLDFGLHEESKTPAAPAAVKMSTQTDEGFTGVVASPGLVLGKIFQAQSELVQTSDNKKNFDVQLELQKLKSAQLQTQIDLKVLVTQLKKTPNEDQVAIFEAHLEVLADPEILALTISKINEGFSAAYAWQESIQEFKKVLAGLQNEVMAGRAHDLQDVGQRVLKHLLGIKDTSNAFHVPFSEPALLVARNLTPSDMVLIDPKKIKGICTVEGGASSHVAIIARSLGLAYLVAVSELVLNIANGTEAILNGKTGLLKLKISGSERESVQNEINQQKEQDLQDFKSALTPALTLDGHHIAVMANVGKLNEAEEAARFGAEGIGLLRSEFLFLHRSTAPTEDEQQKKYQDIVHALAGKNKSHPVIIRTLDVGGDKPLTYLPLPPEENPFLGVRGLRMCLRSPEIFRTQLRALLKTTPHNAVQIMFPMVTTLSELLDAKSILSEECLKLNREKPSVGIMIEVPSAALMADVLAPHVDFFSIGSNDLTQYTLAIDRGHRELAAMADGLHPSVLKLIKITCDAARKYKKMVGVCGGIAGDPFAVPLLVGMGVHELSVSVPVIPSVKAQLRKLKKSECESLVAQALQKAEASEVRKLVEHLI